MIKEIFTTLTLGYLLTCAAPVLAKEDKCSEAISNSLTLLNTTTPSNIEDTNITFILDDVSTATNYSFQLYTANSMSINCPQFKQVYFAYKELIPVNSIVISHLVLLRYDIDANWPLYLE